MNTALVVADKYVINDLLIPAKYWLQKKTGKDVTAVHRRLVACFNQWQEEQADKKGMVKKYHGLPNGLLEWRSVVLDVPIASAKPWQCAGWHVKNEIDLAFHLWLEKYPPFDVLHKELGLQIFACVAIMESLKQEPDINSLLRVNGLLATHMVALLKISNEMVAEGLLVQRRIDAQKQELRRVQKEQAAMRKSQAEREGARIDQLAVAYIQAHPTHGVPEAVRHLREKCGIKLMPSTLKRKLKGIKSRALKQLAKDRHS